MAAFRISRAPSASRDAASPHDPFAKLVFEPALESDELFDALREAFPAIKTHTERKKQAVLDFLMNERRAIEQEITAFVHGTAAAPPTEIPSVQDTTAVAAQDVEVSPAPSVPRKSSCSGDESFSSSSAGPSSSAGSSPEMLSLKQMTSVWTASGNAPPKIHHRRSMTTKEKEEYRRRRQMKACQDCRSRKRKCNHNTNPAAASSTTAVGVSSAKVKKRSQQQQPPQPQSQSHPYHATPSESSFQLDSASVWGDSSLMGSSIMESPLDFADFGTPAAPMGAVEGFDDFLLLPEDDELSSMAFSPDPLFSTNTAAATTTTAMQNTAFPYAYVDPFLPPQPYDHHSLRSGSSASASAFSSPGRSLANSNANAVIAPAQMHQSPQNWDMDLAGVGVNMDFTAHENLLHGQPAMPTTGVGLDSGSSGGSAGRDAAHDGVVNTADVVHDSNTSLHRVIQPLASRSTASPSSSSSSSATSAASSSGRALLHSGAAPQPSLSAMQQPAQTHTCEGVGTPASSAPAVSSSAISTRGLSATSNGNSPLAPVIVNANTTTSSSAPATGLVCYVPQSRTRTTARRGFFGPSDGQEVGVGASGDAARTGRSTRDAPRFTARVLDGHGAASRPFVLVDMEAGTAAVAAVSAARASAAAADVPFVVEGSARRHVTPVGETPRRSTPTSTSTPTTTTTTPASQTATKTTASGALSAPSAALLSILLLAASSTALLPTNASALSSIWSLVLSASVLWLYSYHASPSSLNVMRHIVASPPLLQRTTSRESLARAKPNPKSVVSSLSSTRLNGKVALFGPGTGSGCRAFLSSLKGVCAAI